VYSGSEEAEEGCCASSFSITRRRSPLETPTVLNVDPGRSSIFLPFQTRKKPSEGTSIFVQSVRRKSKNKKENEGRRTNKGRYLRAQLEGCCVGKDIEVKHKLAKGDCDRQRHLRAVWMTNKRTKASK